MAASSTCHAMRNSVQEMMNGSPIPMPNESHIVSKRVPLLEWGISNGYQLQPDRDDDDRKIEFHEADVWVGCIGSFTRFCLTGSLEMLRYLIEVKKCPRKMDYAFKFAAYGGHICVLDWLCKVSDMKKFAKQCPLAASYGGHVDVLDWLKTRLNRGKFFAENVCNAMEFQAALGGHRSVIEWLRDSGYALSHESCRGAAEGGHLELLQWLIEIKCPVPASYVTYYAGKGGSRAMLSWLRDEGYEWDEETCVGAAEGGHIETLRWLIQNGCPTPPDLHILPDAPAMSGQIPMLEWLLDHRYIANEGTCSAAAKYGQLPTLQFLRSRGLPWDAETTQVASAHGRINTLRWALENGCPVNENATLYAANGGHLEIVKLLLKNNCPVTAQATCVAARGGHLEVLKLLMKHGCPVRAQAALEAGKGGHLSVLKMLLKNGIPVTAQNTLEAASRGRIKVLKMLVEEFGCKIDVSECLEVARFKTVIAWLKAREEA